MKIESLKSKIRNGVSPAMATPLQADGYHVNHVALRQLIGFLIQSGARGLFVGGTTGEGILLDVGQRKALHEQTVAAVAGRVPAIIHVGANTTAESVILARHAQAIGADAIAAVTPHFYGVHDDALLTYYHAIAQAAPDTPFLAYDIPQMAVNSVSPLLLHRLVETIPTFAGLKSSHPDAQMVRRLIDGAPEETIILAGNERVALGLLAHGADGLISGLATAVPEPFVALAQAFATGDVTEARRQQRRVNQILDLLPAGARVGAIKAILVERGIDAGPAVPPRPMPPVDWRVWPRIQAFLKEEKSD